MDNTRVFRMSFAGVYPHYVTKAEKKGRTKEELHAIIHWLTGYDEQALQQQISIGSPCRNGRARCGRISILCCSLNAILEKAGGASVSPAIKTELPTRLPQLVLPGLERTPKARLRAPQLR